MKFKTQVLKPPYRVPLMAEIEALPWNGYNVVSTFSGAGGSCLGYRMAGYKVRWANEFIPAAQETYKLNHPDSILDTRDIRAIQPEDILQATGLSAGEIDIFDGSPPCASFSTAGKRADSWGKVKKYSDTEQRVDDLFFEYIRLLSGLQPKIFVAENVSGLVKGVAKGYFKLILRGLKDCGYRVSAKVLDASWLGVPQMRQRLIFVGVRSDLKLDPVHPLPLPYQYNVQNALAPQGNNPIEDNCWIEQYAIGDEWDKIGVGGKSERFFQMQRVAPNKPCPTITLPTRSDFSRTARSSSANACHPYEKRKFSIMELRRLCAFPDDFKLTGIWAQQWERLGRSVPPVMMMHIAKTLQERILARI